MKRGFLNNSKAKARPLGPILPRKAVARSTKTMTPPIGKFDVAVPEGHDTRIEYKESDPCAGGASEGMTWTTLPIDAEPDEPVTECLFFPGSKQVLMNFPDFPQPLMRRKTPYFRTAPTPGKGMGLFSTRTLKMGDVILNERPLFVGARGVDVPCPKGFTREQYIQHSLNALESYFAISVNRMRPEAKAAFMDLANSHTQDGSGPIVGIMRTNALGIEGLRPGVKGEIAEYSAICKDISRLNHSCSPNTAARFDMRSFSYLLFAVRDIAKGEELTLPYTDISCSAAARNEKLRPYAFVCECPSCADAPASDARRAAIAAFKPSVDAWVFDRKLAADLVLTEYRTQLARIVREGLEHHSTYLHVLIGVMNAHICLGDAQNASEWAAKVDKFLWDEKRPDVKELLDPASAAYQAHPFWHLRQVVSVRTSARS